MNKLFVIILILTGITWLSATPTFVPMTSIAEDCASTGCAACVDAYAGISVLEDSLHTGEFISVRHYTQSGDLSNPDSEERVSFYNVMGLPTVVFNGKTKVSGGGTDVSDGSRYWSALRDYRFADAPIKLQITSFNAQTGAITARATMVSPDFVLNNQTIRFLLIENNVTAEATKVTRDIISQNISLSGVNSYQDISAMFTVSPTWVTANLWAVAYVQMTDKAIIQSASTLTQPQYQIRAAFPFSPAIIDSANINFTSEPIWLFNTGAADNFTIRLIQDSGPTDWYFNYCSENGECYPGFIPNPFSLEPGEYAGYHLNLIIGTDNVANFHYLVEAENGTPYVIPFTYNTYATPNSDHTNVQLPVILSMNSPNPFRDQTSFRVYANRPVNNQVIAVFNAKGQKVHEINTGSLKQGLSEIVWNGKDKQGRRLSQGIYFCKIQGLNNTVMRKILIIN